MLFDIPGTALNPSVSPRASGTSDTLGWGGGTLVASALLPAAVPLERFLLVRPAGVGASFGCATVALSRCARFMLEKPEESTV